MEGKTKQASNMVDTYLPFWLFFFLLLLSAQSLFYAGETEFSDGAAAEDSSWGFFTYLRLIGFLLFVSIPILFLQLALLVKKSIEEREKLLFADHLKWNPRDEDTFTHGEDLQYWKLHVEEGRQRWFFHPPSGDSEPVVQNVWEKYFLGIDIVRIFLS